jgi:hypothetical protein
MALVPFTAVDKSTIWDVVLNTYGSVDEIVKIMVDNDYPNVNTYPKNGQIFFFDDTLVENQNNLQSDLSPKKFATAGGVEGVISPDNNTDMGILYSEAFDAEYKSNADGTAAINLAGIIPIGAKIIQIEKEIRPIEAVNYLWNPASAFLTLLNGITVDNNQTLFILYKVLQTS